MDTTKCDVAVVGAGLVGLSLAFELAGHGASVIVIDAGLAGRATSAGAGILSPDTSAEVDEGAFAFGLDAGEHYRHLIEAIAAEGVDPSASGYAKCGLLSLRLRDMKTLGSRHSPIRSSPGHRTWCRRSRVTRRARSSPRSLGSTGSCTAPAPHGSTAGAWPTRCARRPSDAVCSPSTPPWSAWPPTVARGIVARCDTSRWRVEPTSSAGPWRCAVELGVRQWASG